MPGNKFVLELKPTTGLDSFMKKLSRPSTSDSPTGKAGDAPELAKGLRGVFADMGRDLNKNIDIFGKHLGVILGGEAREATKNRRKIFEQTKNDNSPGAIRKRKKAEGDEKRAREKAQREVDDKIKSFSNALEQPFTALKNAVRELNVLGAPVGAATAALLDMAEIGKKLNKQYYTNALAIEGVSDEYTHNKDSLADFSSDMSIIRTEARMPFDEFNSAVSEVTGSGKPLSFLGTNTLKVNEGLRKLSYYSQRTGKSVGEVSKSFVSFNKMFGEQSDVIYDTMDEVLNQQEGSGVGVKTFVDQVMDVTKAFYLFGDNTKDSAKTLNRLARSGSIARETLESFKNLKQESVNVLVDNIGMVIGTQREAVVGGVENRIAELSKGTEEEQTTAAFLKSDLETFKKYGDVDALKGSLSSLDEQSLSDMFLDIQGRVGTGFDKDKLYDKEGKINQEQLNALKTSMMATDMKLSPELLRLVVGTQDRSVGDKEDLPLDGDAKKAREKVQLEYQKIVNEKMLTADDILGMNAAFEKVFMTMGTGLDYILDFTGDMMQKAVDLVGLGDTEAAAEQATLLINQQLDSRLAALESEKDYQEASSGGRKEMEKAVAKEVALSTVMGSRYDHYLKAKELEEGGYEGVSGKSKAIYEKIILETEDQGIFSRQIEGRFKYDELVEGDYTDKKLKGAVKTALEQTQDLNDKVSEMVEDLTSNEKKELKVNVNIYRKLEKD